MSDFLDKLSILSQYDIVPTALMILDDGSVIAFSGATMPKTPIVSPNDNMCYRNETDVLPGDRAIVLPGYLPAGDFMNGKPVTVRYIEDDGVYAGVKDDKRCCTTIPVSFLAKIKEPMYGACCINPAYLGNPAEDR